MDPGLRNLVTSRLEADASVDGAWGVLPPGASIDLVRQAGKLAAWLRGLK